MGSRGGQHLCVWGLGVVNISWVWGLGVVNAYGGGGGMGSRDGQRLKIGLSVISLPEESDNRRAASFITRSN